MKKYTSKSQKIDLYSMKYNLPKEEVNEILSKHEDLLTLEELKIKYDDPDIGILPDWLTEESLDLMIWKTIHDYWSDIFAQRMTKEELYSEHQEYIRKKIHQFENHNHIKGALIKRMMTLANEFTRRGKYFIGSTDEELPTTNNFGIARYKYEVAVEDTLTIEDELFLQNIRDMNDIQVKNLLIITGYLICEIDELRKDYIEVLREADKDIQINLKNIEDIIENNHQIEVNRIENNIKGVRKQKINIKDIIKALKFNIHPEHSNINTILKDLQSYLIEFGIA